MTEMIIVYNFESDVEFTTYDRQKAIDYVYRNGGFWEYESESYDDED